MSDLLGALETANARAIGLDILFDQPSEPEKDAALQRRIAALSVPVVVASARMDDGLTERQHAYLERFTEGMQAAFVNLVKDRADGTVRWIYPGAWIDGRWVPGFAGALAGIAGVEAPRQELPLVYRVGPDRATPPFRIFPAHMVAFLPREWLAGRIVLVGADLPFDDRHRTPFAAAAGSHTGSLPGVVIFAHALAQLLDGRQPPQPGPVGAALLILLAAILGMLLAALDQSLPVKTATLLGAVVLLWAGGFALYHQGGPMIALIAPTIGFASSSGLGVAYLGRRARQQRRFIRAAFSRYVSPAIVDQLLADPTRLNIGGERRELTYLFTDLAGFTSLTERTDPAVLVPLLNEYLDGMSRILFKHGATIDKFVGDAVIAFFNAPVEQADHAARAVAAALELDAFGVVFADRQAANGIEWGVTRIGVHTGTAVIGNVGGEGYFDYTALGDMVNTAARLESVNKHLGTRVCISGVTAAACPELAFRPIGTLVLKGKREGIDVYEPLADGHQASPAVCAYREAFDLLRRNHPGAVDAFRNVTAMNPDDGLTRLYLRRLEQGESGTIITMGEK